MTSLQQRLVKTRKRLVEHAAAVGWIAAPGAWPCAKTAQVDDVSLRGFVNRLEHLFMVLERLERPD